MFGKIFFGIVVVWIGLFMLALIHQTEEEFCKDQYNRVWVAENKADRYFEVCFLKPSGIFKYRD